jgi:hypothetical protein
MPTALERRLAALETINGPDALKCIVIQLVPMGGHSPDIAKCEIGGTTYQRASTETVEDFEARMRDIAQLWSKQHGMPTLVILSPLDVEL